MKRAVLITTMVLMTVSAAAPAFAWGPKTRVSIVTTAARVVSRDSGANLAKLERDIRAGAAVSPSELVAIIPAGAANPLSAIEGEMYLLQAVGGGRVDPYLAYRLGVLGSLVAQVTAPLADSDPTIRDVYYADVEGVIETVQLKPARRAQVDPASYLTDVRAEADERRELILADYRGGLGFKGIAGAAISDDASRSVNAVADVLQAVVTDRVTAANISPSQIRDYAVRAIQFYIRRGNDAETEAAYARLMDMNVATVDLQKQIGDMFYDAGKHERAMKEYKAVLALDPSRRDVTTRIAEYYVKVGDDALAGEQLEDARDAYRMALDSDKLHPSAQSKVLDAEKMIAERDARLAAARESLNAGDEKANAAEQLAFRRDYGGAIALLYDAQTAYNTVTTEFAPEFRAAQNGLLTTQSRLGMLRQELVNNAPSLSGLGGGFTTRMQAQEAAQATDTAALRALIEAQYQAELNRLRAEAGAEIAP
ncbi:MAG: hypothetical protein SGI88_04010 [Candidatus Hydrogenedentes bacterium]|nr:hypothetical protein [Candidatus Hydrogenedentota bacterium]